MPNKPATLCQWCGFEISEALQPTRGRRKQYCSQACRQRAYEKRTGTPRPTGETSQQQRISDGLFEVRCAAEDIETAALEGATHAELAALCHELVARARAFEKLT